ncbi:MAG TPA: hypothetical protein P5514_02840 [Bacteroidales bacterium]|nr:hypothetical protein [Bacteroidales bacterium]HRX95859.1 hypothetical protein [Bacteroidales bacterium]
MVAKRTQQLFDTLVGKATLKQKVYRNTLTTLNMLKKGMVQLTTKYEEVETDLSKEIPFTFKDRSEFEAELKFAGDTLVFMMHTNVFEFPRDHTVMKTPYINEDIERSYCGVINIFNFLSDSFKYQRMNDAGYLIGRLFVNKDMHYFVEGKRELGFLYSNFGTSEVNPENIADILESAIYYTINFDLLVPPYDNIKEVMVQDFITALDSMQMKTGKRMGFRFQADINGK